MEREKTADELYFEAYQELLEKALELNRQMLKELISYRQAYPEHIVE